jgi:hypothetical protein
MYPLGVHGPPVQNRCNKDDMERHVAQWERQEKQTQFWAENLKEREYFEDVGTDG